MSESKSDKSEAFPEPDRRGVFLRLRRSGLSGSQAVDAMIEAMVAVGMNAAEIKRELLEFRKIAVDALDELDAAKESDK